MTARARARFLDRTTPPHIATLVLLASVGALNMATILPALPQIAEYFDTSYAVAQLAVPLYLIGVAVLQLAAGPLSDRYGRRPVALICLVVFVIASLATVFTTSVGLFLFCRVLQAVVAGAFALSRAIVRDIYPGNEAASMIGYVTMGMALVPMLAPMFGGLISDAFGWQAVFVATALGGLAVFAIAWQDLSETALERSATFRAQFAQYPELLKSRRFWGFAFSTAFAAGAFFAFLGGAPFVATTVYGLSDSMSGLGFGAPALGYAVGNFIAARYSTRFGYNTMILFGALITMAGMIAILLTTLTGLDTALLFFTLSSTVGLGNGLTLPNAQAGMMSVRPQLAGTASGLGGAFMIGGGAAFSAMAGFLLEQFGGVMPLVLVMFGSTALGLIPVIYVYKREAELAKQ